MEKYLLSPTNSCQGAKSVNDKKNPTHVDVHNTQDINPDKNFPNPWNAYHSEFPRLCIQFLNPLKIDP